MSVKGVLETFGKRVQQQSKSNLTKAGKKDTGGLYGSIDFKVNVSKRSFSMAFAMEDYGPFIDQGVKGFRNPGTAPNSPFRYGTGSGRKGGLRDAINGWIRRNRIQFRDRNTGKFTDYKQTAFLITRSIYNEGIAPTNFFTKAFENEFKKLPNDLVKAFGLEVEDLMKFALKV